MEQQPQPITNFDKWRFYCKDLESPQPFIDWTWLWTISAALQRRVYLGDEGFPIFPNGFICFVADPGIGKSLAARIAGNQILKKFHTVNTKQTDVNGQPKLVPRISFSADCTSPESLIQQLGAAIRIYYVDKPTKDGSIKKEPFPHNSLAMLLSEEMTSLFRANMNDIPTFLNQWWDAQDFEYKTKHNGEDIIKNVCVSLLGCTTPENMKRLMGQGILDQGFTARALCIYANKHRQKHLLYTFSDEQKKCFEDIKLHVGKLLDINGQVSLSPEAFEWFKDYYESGKLQGEIANKDIKLQHYAGRIKVHVLKVAQWLHFSENTTSKVIDLQTVKNAVAMLRSIEPDMHRALASSSKNPVYDGAIEILDFLRVNGPQRKLAMQIRFTSILDGKQWEEALNFLKLTKQIKEDMDPALKCLRLSYASDSPQLEVRKVA